MSRQNIKVAVDAVLFGYQEGRIYILLIKQKYGPLKGKWALPGGFVRNDESLTHAVRRELKEETGVNVDYLEQLYTFGDDLDRDPRARTISISYFALINTNKVVLKADTDAEEAQWFEFDKIPSLAFDHRKIIKTAKDRLKAKVHYQPIGFNLLSKTFPFSDLENLYTAILEKPIDRRNFRKKVLGFNILQETNQIKKVGAGRPAKMYRFNSRKYKQLLKKGFHFEISFA